MVERAFSESDDGCTHRGPTFIPSNKNVKRRSDFDSDIVFANARCFHLSVLDVPCTAKLASGELIVQDPNVQMSTDTRVGHVQKF